MGLLAATRAAARRALLAPAALAALASLAAPHTAAAQEAVEIGVLKEGDLQVVQDVLYPKSGRLEVGAALGWLPFDPLVTAPKAELLLDVHLKEWLGVSVVLGGGYGLKTGRYTDLESPAYGVAPYAFRYLAGALVGVELAPIYAKAALGGAKVVHFDVFFTAHAGATLEQSVIPGGGLTASPTVALGVGTRVFLKPQLALRIALRDDLVVGWRKLTQSWAFKQNAGITVGLTWLSKPKGMR